MSKQRQKLPKEMTSAELHDRYSTLEKRIRVFNSKIPWVAGAIGVAGLVLAGTLAVLGIAGLTAAVGIASTGMSLAGASMGLGSLVRDTSWNDEAVGLLHESNLRVMIREAEKKRDEAEAERKLKEEFEAAMSALSEGRGIDKSVSVRAPLRLKSKSLFGVFSA